jgi:carbonic anhydrase/acetyltransferase-like protein (isoleucine patch superfamily)
MRVGVAIIRAGPAWRQQLPIYSFQGKTPRIASSAWIADDAVVIGDVVIHEGASVWFNAVIRGDNAPIDVGMNSNIQDGSVLHTDDGIELSVGANVTVGHMVMLHGCTIGDGSLIGIGSTILNHAQIGSECLVGAHSLVTERKTFEDGSMVVGNPAALKKQLTPDQRRGVREVSEIYVRNALRFRVGLAEVSRQVAATAYETSPKTGN